MTNNYKVIQEFKLIKKAALTHNVYELTFEWEKEFSFKSWQFITFLLKVGWRAYSILKTKWKEITLIIKKRESSEWWRWGSKFLCELDAWEKVKWVWPAGHFILNNSNKNKLFLWTWTWFVPLYNQIIWWLENNLDCNFTLIFWTREEKDLFYTEQLEKLKEKHSNFDFYIYTSSEENKYNKWYVTDFLNKEIIKNYEEFYICWIPVMIDSAKKLLIEKWFNPELIYTEKY